MTKKELLFKQEQLQKQLAEVQQQLEKYETAFCINQPGKPYKKYNIAEMNELYSISKRAYEWLNENPQNNILDYNAQCPIAYRVLLEN